MDLGALTSGLLTGLREGVEMALIVSIILAYLVRTGNGAHAPRVLAGAGAAVLVSVVLGVILFVTVGSMPSPYEQIFEGTTMLVAAAVVTWMLFWMRRQAANVKGTLQTAVDRALRDGSALALVGLAFLSILREGIETSLFLVGQATSAAGDAIWVLFGAVIGLAIAALLGVGFYHGSRRLNLGTFFRWTGVALVFIAAGLLARGIHEFIEIGAIGVGTSTLFDLSALLPSDGNVLGEFLHALLGYTATPEVLVFGSWLAYVVAVLALYLRPTRRPPTVTPAAAPVRS